MTHATVEIERAGGVATIWMNRPELHNAFNPQLIDDIDDGVSGAQRRSRRPRRRSGGTGQELFRRRRSQLDERGRRSRISKPISPTPTRLAEMLRLLAELPKPTHGPRPRGGARRRHGPRSRLRHLRRVDRCQLRHFRSALRPDPSDHQPLCRARDRRTPGFALFPDRRTHIRRRGARDWASLHETVEIDRLDAKRSPKFCAGAVRKAPRGRWRRPKRWSHDVDGRTICGRRPRRRDRAPDRDGARRRRGARRTGGLFGKAAPGWRLYDRPRACSTKSSSPIAAKSPAGSSARRGKWASGRSRSILEADAGRGMCALADESRFHRGFRAEGKLSRHRKGHRRRASDGRRGDPSGIRLPVGERAASPGLRRGGTCLHRPAARRASKMGSKSQAKKLMRRRACR